MLIPSILKYSAVIFGLFQLASSADFRCYLDSTNYVEAPVASPGPLINGSKPCVDITKPTCFVAIGYKFLLDGPLLSALIPALLTLAINVVLVNWVEEAGDGEFKEGLGLGYLGHAVPESQKVGKLVGEGIADLVLNYNLNTNITTVGHSLGCSLLSVAADSYKSKTNKIFEQAIVMDTARLGFDPPIGTKVPNKNDANHVMASHTDPGGYALNEAVGHADFWFNYKSFAGPFPSRRQPGCGPPTTMQEMLTSGNRCNHDLAWKTFVEAVLKTATFTGGLAATYSEAVEADGNFAVTNNYGPGWDYDKQGNFYLRTSPDKPYGLGQDGLNNL